MNLGEYLRKKDVPVLVDKLIQKVISDKPDNVLQFLIDELDEVKKLKNWIPNDDRFEILEFNFNDTHVRYWSRVDKKTYKKCPVNELEINTLPTSIWPASFPFAEFLTYFDFKNKSVLELGSGVGLTGLVAAKKGAKHVALSDMSITSVALCELSFELNCFERDSVSAHQLSWGVQSDLNNLLDTRPNQEKFDYVIGADVFYFGNSLKLGLKTAWQSLKPGGTFICVSAVRSDEIEDALRSLPTEMGWLEPNEPFVVESAAKHEGMIYDSFDGITLFEWVKPMDPRTA